MEGASPHGGRFDRWWADGTRRLIFEPLTLLEKLAALTQRPRINLVSTTGTFTISASGGGNDRQPALTF